MYTLYKAYISGKAFRQSEQVVLKKMIRANLFSRSFYDTVPYGLEILNSGNGSPSAKAKPSADGTSSRMQAARDNRLIVQNNKYFMKAKIRVACHTFDLLYGYLHNIPVYLSPENSNVKEQNSRKRVWSHNLKIWYA